jgi:putative ABC transport system permease protein
MTAIRSVISELRSAARQLSRRPLLLLLAVVPLALSIGVLSALFALVNGILLRPAAGIDVAQGQLVEIGRGEQLDTLSYPLFEDLARAATSVEAVFGWKILPVNVRAGGSGASTRALGMLVSGQYFEALGVRATQGRLLTPADDAAGTTAPRVVLSHLAFERMLGGDPARLSQPIMINGQAYAIVGVAEPTFRGHIALLAPDYYLPITLKALAQPSSPRDLLSNRGSSWVQLGARLTAQRSIEDARTELRALAERIEAGAGPGHDVPDVLVEPLRAVPNTLTAGLATFTGLLAALTAAVLLVACSNVAGWLLARGESRLTELGLRMALGASRLRILGLLLAEAVVVAALAGSLAVFGARALLGLLPAIDIPAPFPVSIAVPFDTPVMVFALLATAVSVLAAGLAPALRISRALRAMTTGARVTRRSRARELLVCAQVALTVLLLSGAGLFAVALQKSQAIEIGFDPRHLANADLDLEPSGYSSERQQALLTTILDRIRATPGVQAAALANLVPLTLSRMSFGAVVDDRSPEDALSPSVNVVSPGYFDAMGIALHGRDFATSDRLDGEGVVVINRRLAERLFGAEDPIGRTFRYGSVEDARTLRVIGVAADGRYASYQESPEAFMYFALAQYPTARLNLMLRSALPAATLEAAIAAAVTATDPELPPPPLHAMRDSVALSLLPQRIAALIAGVLGGLGLLLAGLGLYALMAQFVAARTREIGVRLSLGATPARVATQVARRGGRLIIAGVGIGLVGALALSQLAQSMLLGIDADSVLTVCAAALVVMAVGIAACVGPARRAARIEPVVALRHD